VVGRRSRRRDDEKGRSEHRSSDESAHRLSLLGRTAAVSGPHRRKYTVGVWTEKGRADEPDNLHGSVTGYRDDWGLLQHRSLLEDCSEFLAVVPYAPARGAVKHR